MMEKAVVDVGYDVKKMPLGELSKETGLKGMAILKEVEEVISGKVKGDLTRLSSQFYTTIPHNFGMQKMYNFIIDQEDKLRDKLYLVSSLIAIQEAHHLMKKPSIPKK